MLKCVGARYATHRHLIRLIMITYLQALILGLIQGATELFPVSSLGHSVILPSLFGWHIDQGADFFLAFLVATHLATALVLLGFFAKDWWKIISGMFRSLKERVIRPEDSYARLGWLIVVGTIPVGILGILFEKSFQALFASPRFAVIFLICNGVLLLSMEMYKRRRIAGNSPESAAIVGNVDERAARLSWSQSVKIGIAQCLALIPGFSRTGATLGGGLLVGLDHESAARFSFLMATPVIFAAAVLKLPELALSGQSGVWGPIVFGAIASAIAAYLSVKFLTKYFRTHTLLPFAVYCVVFGVIALLVVGKF
jgi:undecaprenyl-diphosphatase